MSDMYHPPVGFHEFDAELEWVFAEEAYDVLRTHATYSGYYDSETDSFAARFMTSRLDLIQDYDETVCVRLRLVQQVNATKDNVVPNNYLQFTVNHDVSNCTGLVLEYAKYDEELFAEYYGDIDEVVDWRSYVFVGIAKEDQDTTVVVLNAENGTELTDEDKMSALQVLRALRAHLAASALLFDTQQDEEEAAGVPDLDTYLASNYGKFDPTEFPVKLECNYCNPSDTYCVHDDSLKN